MHACVRACVRACVCVCVWVEGVSDGSKTQGDRGLRAVSRSVFVTMGGGGQDGSKTQGDRGLRAVSRSGLLQFL